MLEATFYFVTKSTFPLQIAENSEIDLGSIPDLKCNSCTCSNSQPVKTVKPNYNKYQDNTGKNKTKSTSNTYTCVNILDNKQIK